MIRHVHVHLYPTGRPAALCGELEATDDGLIGSIGSTLKKTGSLIRRGSSLTKSVRAGDGHPCTCDSCRRHGRGLT